MNDTIKLTIKPVWQVHPKNNQISHNDFYIYDCVTDNKDILSNSRGYLSVKGKMHKLDLNVPYETELKFAETHPTFGSSYWVQGEPYRDIPDTAEGQKEYLLSILTDLQVQEIYKVYPDQDIIEMFTNDTLDYKLVRGFGETTYQHVKQKIIDNLQYKELFSSFRKYGLSPNLIKKVVDEFGSVELAIQKIKNNTYELTKVSGIGFIKADTIAMSIVQGDLQELVEEGEITTEEASIRYTEAFRSEYRIRAGINHCILEEQNDGHTYITEEKLIVKCLELLNIDSDFIRDQLIDNNNLFITEDKISLKETYLCEKYIAKFTYENVRKSTELDFDPDKFIARMENKYKDILKNGLSEKQKEFIHNVKEYNIHLLIGFAGTGKSMMQKLLKDLLLQLGLTSLWLTPTASAAKVLSGYLGDGSKTYTIHRGTRKATQTIMEEREDEEGNIYEEEVTGIFVDYIIVDEFSMVDIFLCTKLFSLLKNPNVRILFVGDSFQNVAISCGNILQNMIDSNVVPKVMLDEVFRQSEGGILDVATKIRRKEKFLDDNFVGTKMFGDNLLFHCVPYYKDKPSEHMDEGFEYYYTSYIKNGYLPEEILSMSPTKKGKLGTVELNKRVQNIINPASIDKKEIELFKGKDEDEFKQYISLRVGDYIVNTVNTYDIENVSKNLCDVVNGDTGIIKDIITDWKPEPKKHELFDDDYGIDGEIYEDENKENEKQVNLNGIYIQFDNDEVKFEFQDKHKLLHAWCMTIHKAQGMGNKTVLLVFDKSHLFGMNANMLYVALTRATENAIVVCQARVLNWILEKFANLMRNTRLEEILIEVFNEK